MFLDVLGETLGNVAVGFSQGWNQSLGYQSRQGFQYDPYTGRYYPLATAQAPVYQYPVYYPNTYNTGGDMLPLLLIGGVLLFALMKD